MGREKDADKGAVAEPTAYEKAVVRKQERLDQEKRQKRKLYIYSALAIVGGIVALAVVLGYPYAA